MAKIKRFTFCRMVYKNYYLLRTDVVFILILFNQGFAIFRAIALLTKGYFLGVWDKCRVW